MSLKVDIDWKDVYKMLCKQCRGKLKNYVKDKIAEQLADELLGAEKNIKEES